MEPTARFLAETINPLFVGLLLVAPFFGRTPRPRPFWLAAAGGLAAAVVLAEGGKRLTQSSFPSGHETFALACGTALVCGDSRWLWAVAPVSALMGWALVTAGYHQPRDIAGALLTGPPPALIAQALRRRYARE